MIYYEHFNDAEKAGGGVRSAKPNSSSMRGAVSMSLQNHRDARSNFLIEDFFVKESCLSIVKCCSVALFLFCLDWRCIH